MLKSIRLRNFMSHVDSQIELTKGLNVIVGDNNIGKSAIVAALQILSSNSHSMHVCRHGAKTVSVEVETEEGDTIIWSRTRSPSYKINGELFDRLKKSGTPENLHEVLKLPKVVPETGEAFDIHFGEQKSPVFLFDKSDTAIAQFFAASSDASKLMHMQKLHKSHLRDATLKKRELDSTLEVCEAELKLLKDADALKNRSDTLAAQYDEIMKESNAIRALEKMLLELEAQNASKEEYSKELEVLKTLSAPPAIKETAQLEQIISAIKQEEHNKLQFSMQTECLKRLNTPPIIPDELPLENLINELEDTLNEQAYFAAQDKALSALGIEPEITDTADLELLTKNILRQNLELKRHQGTVVALEDLTSPPVIDETAQIAEIRESLLNNMQQVKDDTAQLALATKRMDAAQKKMQLLMEEVGVCPTCGQLFAPLKSGGHNE